MDLVTLYDPGSATIVVGGTLLATGLRCGARDSLLALRALGGLTRRRFAADRTRQALAQLVRSVRQDGLVRARGQACGDAEVDSAVGDMLARRSLAALGDAHAQGRAARRAADDRASSTLSQGAELAPVFGLAGTLISLAQLRAAGPALGDFASAVGMAVLTTLYGLLLSHIILAPLARVVERTRDAEDRAREDVIEWLRAQLEMVLAQHREPRVVAVS